MARRTRRQRRTGEIGKLEPTIFEKRAGQIQGHKGKITNPQDYIDRRELQRIRDSLTQSHAGYVIEGMTNKDARGKLEEVVRREFKAQTQGRQELIDYIVRETVGTGVIEDIMDNDHSITDIGYNGSHLIVESSDRKYIYSDDDEVDDDYIIRLVNKYAHANGRDFTEKDPIFDGTFENVRINAMYGSNTVPNSGVTMALRVVRPRLALIKSTFETFAPMYIYDLFEAFVKAKGNFVIAGETGTGKTELQKLLASFVPFEDRIVLIEDVAETFIKDMFPDKDVYSWLTSQTITITHLVKAALRNNPRWIMVAETRGEEAYEMIQAVLSGHSIITTVHAVNAKAIPKRMINMAKMGYEFSEEGLESDIRRYFDFGLHIIRVEHEEKTIRYLSELLFFDEEKDHLIFKQDFVNGRFICQTSELPDAWKRRLARLNFDPNMLQEYMAHDRYAEIERIEHEEEGVTELQLSFRDGGEVSIEELYKYVDNDDIISIAGDKAKILREQKERERQAQESIDAGERVESQIFQDSYEEYEDKVESEAERRMREIKEQQDAARDIIKPNPKLVRQEEINQRESKIDEPSVYGDAVEMELERIRQRQRQRKQREDSRDD